MAKLTTERMIQTSLQAARLAETVEVSQQIASITEKVKVFEAVVWFPKLQKIVNDTTERGMSGTCRGIKVLTWCCAGRCLIQLERGDARLTLITADDESSWSRENASVAPNMGPMGIQGIDAEPIDALTMLYEVTRYADTLGLKPDRDVSI